MNISEELATNLEAVNATKITITRDAEALPFFVGKVSPKKPTGEINVIINEIIAGDLNYFETFGCPENITTNMYNLTKTYNCKALNDSDIVQDEVVFEVNNRLEGSGYYGDNLNKRRLKAITGMPIPYISSGFINLVKNGSTVATIGNSSNNPWQYLTTFTANTTQIAYQKDVSGELDLTVEPSTELFKYALYYVNRFGGISWVLGNIASEASSNITNNTVNKKSGIGIVTNVLNKDVTKSLKLKTELMTADEYNNKEEILYSPIYWLWDKDSNTIKQVNLSTTQFIKKNSWSNKLTQLVLDIDYKEKTKLW